MPEERDCRTPIGILFRSDICAARTGAIRRRADVNRRADGAGAGEDTRRSSEDWTAKRSSIIPVVLDEEERKYAPDRAPRISKGLLRRGAGWILGKPKRSRGYFRLPSPFPPLFFVLRDFELEGTVPGGNLYQTALRYRARLAEPTRHGRQPFSA